MPPVDFDVLCGLLKSYNQKRKWYWGVINKTEQDEMINQLMQWRPQSEQHSKDKKKEKRPVDEVLRLRQLSLANRDEKN
jgi:hypothetical protein